MTVEPETLETVRASRNRMLETWRAVEAALYGWEHQVGLYSFRDTHRGVVRLIKARHDLLAVAKQYTRYCKQWREANGEFPGNDGRPLIEKNMLAVIADVESVA